MLADAYRMSYLPRNVRHVTTCDSTRMLQARYLKGLHSVKRFSAQSVQLVLRFFRSQRNEFCFMHSLYTVGQNLKKKSYVKYLDVNVR